MKLQNIKHFIAEIKSWFQCIHRWLKGCCIMFERKQRNAMQTADTDNRRITVKTVMQNFGELWGVSNLNIFRTIGHLMWRPGYMIRDYLDGKRNKYLQPVKLLIVTTLIMMQVAYFLKVEIPEWNDLAPRLERMLSEIPFDESELEDAQIMNAFVVKCTRYYDSYRHWRNKNRAFGMVTHSVISVLLVWLLFRKSPRPSKMNYNIAEISTAFLYILCQLQVLTLFFILFTRDVHNVDTAILLPGILVQIVILIDLKQLFQRSWWGTIWRTFLSVSWIM